MNTPVVPPPPPPTQPTPLPPLSTIATVLKPPPALIQAQINTLFETTVILGGEGKGAVEVASQFGNLRLQSTLAFAKGTTLGLQLLSTVPKLTVQIVSLDGKALPQATAWNRAPAQPGTLPLTDSVQTGLLSGGIPKGAPILATVLRGTPLAGQSGQPTLSGGYGPGIQSPTHPSTTLGAPTAPHHPTSTVGGDLHGGPKTAPTLPQMQAALNTMLNGGSKPLPPGTQIQVRIIAVNQGGQPVPSLSATSSPQAIAPTASAANQAPAGPAQATSPPGSVPPPFLTTGAVVGATPQGQTLLQTDNGIFALETKAPLATGARVTIQIDAQQIVQRTLQPSNTRDGTPHWGALREAIEVLNESNPALARQVINAAIPRPDASLGSTMVFFLAALRVGTFRNILGESALRVLERDRPTLLGKAGEEFNRGNQRVSDPVTGDWRLAYLPMLQNQHMGEIRIALREQGKEGKTPGEEDGEGTRFIVDVQVERFGRIQFDGLAKSKKKRFDLIIRTNTAMSSGIRKDINEIFTKTCEAYNLSAQLLFQVSPKFVEMGGVEMDKDTLGMIV